MLSSYDITAKLVTFVDTFTDISDIFTDISDILTDIPDIPDIQTSHKSCCITRDWQNTSKGPSIVRELIALIKKKV